MNTIAARSYISAFRRLLILLLLYIPMGIAARSQTIYLPVQKSLLAAGPESKGDSVSVKSKKGIYSQDSLFSFRSQKGYFPSLLHNVGEQAAAPFHFGKKEWLMTGTAALITAGLVMTDGKTDDVMKVLKSRHEWIRKASPVVTGFGSRTGYGTVIAFGTLSAIIKNKKGVETSLMASQAVLTSGLWVQMIKILTGRERPFRYDISGNSVPGKWYGPFAQYSKALKAEIPGASFESFPSGHTATAFSIATVFAMQYRDKKAVPIISYSAATLVGVSRLTEHRHWASDVFTGALLGYLCGRQVVNHFNKVHGHEQPATNRKLKQGAEIRFMTYNNQMGLIVTW